jgi:BirA family biotin operon repressor/biotin-[acetyl-CoA-carboxylase] ligase
MQSGIEQLLTGAAQSCHVVSYEHLPSTNTTARELAKDGAADGTVVIADRQSAGRGRLQRAFFSPEGTGLYMSVIVRRDLPATDALRLTTMAAVATAQTIECMIGRQVGIKWVNDIYLDGKKVCGILTEGSILPGEKKLQYAVIGIGVNITPREGGFPPEIAHIAGAILPSVDDAESARSTLAAGILNRLMFLLDQDDPNLCLDEYRRHLILRDRDIIVYGADETPRFARALDIDEEYRLLVRFEDGSQAALDSGEVSIKL